MAQQHASAHGKADTLCSKRWLVSLVILISAIFSESVPGAAQEKRLTLQALVLPATVFYQDGQVVKFAVHGFLEFQNLNELFNWIDAQAARWQFSSPQEREEFTSGLLLRGMRSRLISMQYEKPLEILVTHTARELSATVDKVPVNPGGLIFKGAHWQVSADQYRSNFMQLRQHWLASLNCWSAAPSIPARVLSNWYLIDEGIDLYGARYDSTEHFWQAVKYHPEIRLKDLLELLDVLNHGPWKLFLESLSADQGVYLKNTYAIEFLRSNLQAQRREWFRKEVALQAADGNHPARAIQQRSPDNAGSIRYTAMQEKILWGDLADIFHLIYFFATTERELLRIDGLKPVVDALQKFHFDAIYLDGYRGGKVGFISPEYRQLMLELWKVKYLEMERFGDVIRSTRGVYLDHFLNDGDSPDIPIPIYVGYLNQIREMALRLKP